MRKKAGHGKLKKGAGDACPSKRGMKRILLITLLSVVLTGCVAYYSKPGMSTADFDRDKQYCRGIAEQEAIRKHTRICDEIDLCLVNKKGWKRD